MRKIKKYSIFFTLALLLISSAFALTAYANNINLPTYTNNRTVSATFVYDAGQMNGVVFGLDQNTVSNATDKAKDTPAGANGLTEWSVQYDVTLADSDGSQTVYAKFRNDWNFPHWVGSNKQLPASGGWIYSGTTILDRVAPSAPTINFTSPSGYSSGIWTNQDVKFTITDGTDDRSGVAKSQYSYDGSTWNDYSSERTIPTTEGFTTIYVRTLDKAGNISVVTTKTVRIDKTAPTGSISINGGAANTNSTNVNLDLTSTDSTVMKVGSDASFTGSHWQAFADTGWKGSWWIRNSSNYTTIDKSITPSYTTIDNDINYVNYSPGGNANYYNAEITGSLYPKYNEAYTIYVTSDDGVKIWFDGATTPNIDKWISQGPTTYQFTTPVLSAGSKHTIIVQHFQGNGGEKLTLEWSSASLSRQLIVNTFGNNVSVPEQTGWSGLWWRKSAADYKTIDETLVPAFSGIYDKIDFSNHSVGGRTDYINGRFQGYIKPTYSQAYKIYVTGDDGVKLYFNGSPVVFDGKAAVNDGWVDQGATTYVYTTPVLQKDKEYKLELEFYQGGGPSRLMLEWSSASQTRQAIPCSSVDTGVGNWTVSSGDGTKNVYIKYADAAGNISSNYNASITIDTAPPTVSGTSPANGATGTSVGNNITVTFSEDIAQSTAWSNITLKNSSGTTIATTNSISGKVLTIDPSVSLSESTTYTVTISASALKDNAGNNLASAYTFSFTTLEFKLNAITVSGSRYYGDPVTLQAGGSSIAVAKYRIFSTTAITAPDITDAEKAASPGNSADWTDTGIAGDMDVNSSTSISKILDGTNFNSGNGWTYVTFKVYVESPSGNNTWKYSEAYSLIDSSVGIDEPISYVGHNQIIRSQVAISPTTAAPGYNVNTIKAFSVYAGDDKIDYRLEFDLDSPAKVYGLKLKLDLNSTDEDGIQLRLDDSNGIRLVKLSGTNYKTVTTIKTYDSSAFTQAGEGNNVYTLILGSSDIPTTAGRYAVEYVGDLSVVYTQDSTPVTITNEAELSYVKKATGEWRILQPDAPNRKMYINTLVTRKYIKYR